MHMQGSQIKAPRLGPIRPVIRGGGRIAWPRLKTQVVLGISLKRVDMARFSAFTPLHMKASACLSLSPTSRLVLSLPHAKVEQFLCCRSLTVVPGLSHPHAGLPQAWFLIYLFCRSIFCR